MDADGVAITGVKELHKMIAKRDAKIAQRDTRIAALEERLTDLEAALTQLLAAQPPCQIFGSVERNLAGGDLRPF